MNVEPISVTNRQLDVLRLLADGRSTIEIASKLDLSPATVRNHVANLLAALGVHNRLQAVVAATKAGILDLDDSAVDATASVPMVDRRRNNHV